MSRFSNLADRTKGDNRGSHIDETGGVRQPHAGPAEPATQTPPSRVGRKAIAAYFSPEMSLAMHVCARKNDLSLQALMAEAFDDILRKYGESPIGG
jgi:hypothetical protein